ncbi:MAG: hypothetical protein IKQ24_07230 [Verrucomicrobia bacterium]|nr:hypothetical protein [Verrucomicrobiota bacterium]
MSIRKHLRTIAKARMAAMGVERVNRKMGLHWSQHVVSVLMRRGNGRKLLAKMRAKKVPNWRRVISVLMRRGNGRKLLAKMRAKKVPNWRRVISGDLSKDGRRAQYAK